MRKTAFLLFAAAVTAAVAGCAGQPQKTVIATIGDYSLYEDDFRSELSLYPPEYRQKISREQLLENIIQKKVLLLEAQRRGLDRDPQFMKMVERFWEQSLLRSLLDRKSEEILSSLAPPEKDRNKKAAELMRSWIEELEKKARVTINRQAFEKIEIK